MKSRVVTSPEEICSIIGKCQVCHVGMADSGGNPYVLPMNFGFDGQTVYLHSSRNGKKIELLQNNPSVCIAFSTDHLLRFQSEEMACSYSMRYRSVLAFGKVEFIEDEKQKRKILSIIMKNYSPKEFIFNAPSVREVCCWQVSVEKFDCRVYGY